MGETTPSRSVWVGMHQWGSLRKTEVSDEIKKKLKDKVTAVENKT